MRLPEQRLWDRMRGALVPEGVLLKRIENLVGEGMPDVVAACRGRVTFIELKALRLEDVPVRSRTPLLGKQAGLSPEQRNWHLGWNRAGCPTLILVGVGLEIVAISGLRADAVNTLSLAELRSESVANSWQSLRQVLGATG
jgi:hypothetical protein